MSDAKPGDNATTIDALLAERAGYADRAKVDDRFKDRLAAVDEQLKLRGAVSRAKRGPGEPPAGRAAPPAQTA
jgi:hypothetical protein